MSLTGRALVAAGFAFGRANDVVERAQGAARGFVGAFLGSALDRPERSALSIALYDATAHTWYRADGLFDWEAQWLAKRLPPPPAKLLIAAAGAGREAVALAHLGYSLHVFDPAPSAIRDCVARLHGRVHAVVTTYEDLSASVLDGTSTSADSFRGERYDAVLLGWGSICHVLDPNDRARAFQACANLAPTGPLLCTFPVGRADLRREGRGARLGHRLGESVRRMRGAIATDAGDVFVPEFGFAHHFTQSEVDDLAIQIARRVERDGDAIGYRHATFIPPSGGPAAR